MDDLGINGPGCGETLTYENVGGYRCYCKKCVDAMPELPDTGGSFLLSGSYPGFKWVESDAKM